jgi:putative transposase
MIAMSSHVFHEIYLHLNWHTKDNLRLMTPGLESDIHEFLRERCRQTKGVYFHGIGGTEDHVHLAINIEPFVTISNLIGELKGSCSREINHLKRMKALEWQRGFGVVSFGLKQLGWVQNYIANQKEHHARGNVFDKLERTEFVEEEAG